MAMAQNKYNARRVTVDGTTYDSKREAKICEEFKILERAGQITNLVIHPSWTIEINGVHICDYTADASYYDVRGGNCKGFHVIDVKSDPTITDRFRLVCKLMKAVHQIDVEIVK